MKKILTVLFAILVLQVFAQTNVIYFPVANVQQTPQPGVKVQVTLLTPWPQTSGNIGTRPDYVPQFTDTNGIAWFTNLVWGNYGAQIFGRPGISWAFSVLPTTLGTVNGFTLNGAGLYTNSLVVVPYGLRQGTNVIFGTNADGTLTINGSATGGGGGAGANLGAGTGIVLSTNAGQTVLTVNTNLFDLSGAAAAVQTALVATNVSVIATIMNASNINSGALALQVATLNNQINTTNTLTLNALAATNVANLTALNNASNTIVSGAKATYLPLASNGGGTNLQVAPPTVGTNLTVTFTTNGANGLVSMTISGITTAQFVALLANQFNGTTPINGGGITNVQNSVWAQYAVDAVFATNLLNVATNANSATFAAIATNLVSGSTATNLTTTSGSTISGNGAGLTGIPMTALVGTSFDSTNAAKNATNTLAAPALTGLIPYGSLPQYANTNGSAINDTNTSGFTAQGAASFTGNGANLTNVPYSSLVGYHYNPYTNAAGQVVVGTLGGTPGAGYYADTIGNYYDIISGGNNSMAISTNLTVLATNFAKIFVGSGAGLTNLPFVTTNAFMIALAYTGGTNVFVNGAGFTNSGKVTFVLTMTNNASMFLTNIPPGFTFNIDYYNFGTNFWQRYYNPTNAQSVYWLGYPTNYGTYVPLPGSNNWTIDTIHMGLSTNFFVGSITNCTP